MPVSELKLQAAVDMNSTVDNKKEETPGFVDRSEMLFSYMNMIAFNNKVDLKLN